MSQNADAVLEKRQVIELWESSYYYAGIYMRYPNARNV